MKNTRLCIALTAGLAACASAQSVIGYTITDAARSGMGNWHHDYNGTITDTGTDTVVGAL